MKLRSQLTLAFSLVVLLGVGVTGGLLISFSYQRSMTRLKGEQLLLAENRAGAISEEVAAEVARLHYLSTLAELDLTDENLEPEKAMLRHAQHDPRFFSLETSAVSPSGQVIWTEPPGAPALAGVSQASWFAEARSSRESFVVEERDPGGTAKARLVVPLWRSSGAFAGCLTSILDPSTTTRWSERLRVDLGKSGSASIIDRSGRTVVSLGSKEPAEFPGRAEAVDQAQQGKEVSAWSDDRGGRSWLLTAVPLPHTGWSLLLRQARDELDDDLDGELATFAGVLALGLFSALLLGLAYSRALARPVVALSRVAREVERGHFETVPTPTRTDELGDLERAFSSMTSTLEAKVRARTEALQQAQALLVAQGRFAAMGKTAAAIAHELKNALNGLGVAVELLTQGKLSPAAQEPIREQVRSEVERLRDITDNLNIFAGPPRLNRAPQDLRTLVDRALLLLADRIAEAEVQVEVLIPENLPAVPCDGHKLQGVLINLLKNAVEAVEPELDAVAGARPRVEVSARLVGDQVQLEVADSGPGIAEEVAHHMFEPFFTTKRTGTGLGLIIARKVLEAHGGHLSWEPNQPRGTRMRLVLPMEPVGVVPPAELPPRTA